MMIDTEIMQRLPQLVGETCATSQDYRRLGMLFAGRGDEAGAPEGRRMGEMLVEAARRVQGD